METSAKTRAKDGVTSATVTPEERDHVDRFLDELGDAVPRLDPSVEGIVDRIMGLSRRLRRMTEETLAERGLNLGEYKVLCFLRNSGPPYRVTPGRLAEWEELSTGAMTNRLDRLEAAGLVRRLPDLDDRRSLQVELTDQGHKAWQESASAQAVKEAVLAAALDEPEKGRLNALLRKLMLEFEHKEAAKDG